MSISISTYYYRPCRSRAYRDFSDAQLRDEIESIQAERPYVGYRMVRNYLFRRHGRWVNGKRIRRVMKLFSLQARVKRRFIRTTDPDHPYPIYPNLISGRTVTDINQVWVADLTYIRIATGFVFLAVILDVFSRRVVGWALSKALTHALTREALKMALALRNPAPGLIHHSDRGAQYACEKYVALLQEHSIQVSMSATGNPYHNAFAESFIKTLKKEEVYLGEYVHFIDVVESIPSFIEDVYNRKRLHSSIHYLPPVEFEAILSDKNARKQLGQVNLSIY